MHQAGSQPRNTGGVHAVDGLAPDRLELEITEGVFLADSNGVDETFSMLKGLGVRLAVDDFGTGYSSLSYLERFPIDIVKIDQSFVRNITTDPGNATIAQAIIAMSHKLGKIALDRKSSMPN